MAQEQPERIETDASINEETQESFEVIKRQVHHEKVEEYVPHIFAFAMLGKRHDLFDSSLLPPNLSEQDSYINWASPKDGITVLHMAAMYGKTPFLKQLITVGVDVAVEDAEGNTPLMSAIRAGRSSVCVELIKKMSVAQINHANKEGETSIFIAAHKGNGVVLQRLLRHKADCNLATESGVIPLMVALQQNNTECVNALIAAGSQINVHDANGRNCLHYYAKAKVFNVGTVNAIRKITEINGLLDACDKDGHKPIHYAVEVGIEDIVNHFLSLSSLKDVGVVYDEVETVCKSSRRQRILTGRDRISVLMKTDSLGYEIDGKNEPKKMDLYINSEKRCNKWGAMIENFCSTHKITDKLIFRLYKGVPLTKRADLWSAFLGIDEVMASDIGKSTRLDYGQSSDDDQIHKDVTRAHQNNIKFMCRFSEGQKLLFLILKAYSHVDTETGYVQGMADLFGFNVLVFSNLERSFWSMYQMMQLPKYNLRSCFLPGFPGVEPFRRLEVMMLKKYHRDVYNHLEALGGFDALYPHFLEFYALWFSRVFTGDLAIWLLDIIIVEGWQATLSIASAIYFIMKGKILQEEDVIGVDTLLKKPQDQPGFNKFVFIKCVKKFRIPPHQVNQWVVEQ